MATLEEQLQALYLEELGREADAGGLQFYLDAMSSGDKNLAQIATELSRSTEGLEYDPTGNLTANSADTAINYLYAQELNRNAEQGGLDYYSDLLSSGDRELNQILAEISLSEEGRLNDATESIGSQLTYFDPNKVEEYVRNAYATELGREVDEEGLNFYINKILNDPTQTVATTLQALSRSEEGLNADIGDLVFNALSGEGALATAAELDQSVYQPFEDIYGGTDEATGLLGTQLFADRTATYQQRDAITAAANEAAAKGDTVLAEGLQKQADALTDKLGTSSPWTIGETTGGTRDIYDVLEKGGIATVDPTTGNLAGGNEGVTNYNLDYNAASNVSGAGANQTDVAKAAAAAGISIDDQYAKNATNTFNDSFNYGQYGKRPDETLTQYYDRLATERQGGILGQGLLSATPTVGSDAWEAMQAVYDNPAEMVDTLNQMKVTSSGNYEPMDSSVGITPTMRDTLQSLAEAPMLFKALFPYGGLLSKGAELYVNSQASDTTNNYLNTGRGFSEDGNTYTTSWGDVIDTSKLSEAAKRGLAISLADQANYSEGEARAREDYGDNGSDYSVHSTTSSDILGGSNIYTDATTYGTTNSAGIDTANPTSGLTIGDATVSDAQFERDVLANGLS